MTSRGIVLPLSYHSHTKKIEIMEKSIIFIYPTWGERGKVIMATREEMENFKEGSERWLTVKDPSLLTTAQLEKIKNGDDFARVTKEQRDIFISKYSIYL